MALDFSPYQYPFPSRRMVHYASRGMVSATHPEAANAGLTILHQGGNAVDAAIAMAATLTVVEPASNGLGSDNFALVWSGNKLYGLNSSGFSPKGLTYERLTRNGETAIPNFGWEAVTVPGAPAGWAALSQRFGKLPFSKLLEPAIEAAENGHAVTAHAVGCWERVCRLYHEKLGALADPFLEVFSKQGEPYRPGEVFRSPGHAKTLRRIAESQARDFYEGEIAEAICRFARETGGYLEKEDLAAYEPSWVEPISVKYRGYDVWEIPPNGQGIVALMALNILKGYSFEPSEFGSARALHLQMEAIKLAFADAARYVSDIRTMPYSPADLLSEAFAAQRRREISETEARDPHPGTPPSGGTVYFAAADCSGTMISMIQSNYMGFGSGICIPGYGITMQNRGVNFSLEKGHANVYAPRKRPYHTIIPGFLTKDGEAVGPFGVMGGFMQPQGHLQVIMNTLDFHMNPQAALDAPRFCWEHGKNIQVEGYNDAVIQELKRKGHLLRRISLDDGGTGRGQIIWKTPYNTLCGGTEPRGDGTIYSY